MEHAHFYTYRGEVNAKDCGRKRATHTSIYSYVVMCCPQKTQQVCGGQKQTASQLDRSC